MQLIGFLSEREKKREREKEVKRESEKKETEWESNRVYRIQNTWIAMLNLPTSSDYDVQHNNIAESCYMWNKNDALSPFLIITCTIWLDT